MFQNGGEAVEVDLQYTMDGVPVLLHDFDVDRTTNGSGRIWDMVYDEVKTLNAAQGFNYTITGTRKTNDVIFEKIPTLHEAVAACKKHNMVIDLDVKSSGRKLCRTLKSISDVYPDASEFIFVTSFFPQILYQMRTECPEFVVGMIWYKNYISRRISGQPRFPWYVTVFLDGLDVVMEWLKDQVFPDFLGLSLVVVHKDEMSPRMLQRWRVIKKIEVLAWTVNHPIEKQYLRRRAGVPIITDSLTDRDDCGEQND